MKNLKSILGALSVIFFSLTAVQAQRTLLKMPLNYYLNTQNNYDPAIPTPEQFLGYQIGEQHISHDQIVAYFQELERLSDRLRFEILGRTHEFRAVSVLYITTAENHKNLEKIRTEHLKLSDPSESGSVNIAQMPVVLYQGHSIHGNEPSGANASVLAAYHWAAARSAEATAILENTVILLDPAFNPDGVQRFSQWVNTHRSKTTVTDPATREYSEVWPYGRTNHYWFDLNRDWLVAQQPESKARVKLFQDWKPNILTDHHEMGSNSTFFFQPGVPSRVNRFTPPKNQELTGKIAGFHAKALDKIGSLYYTKENFDDFYYGKGSTYPDVNGCVGILFEQASSRGHAQRTQNGVLTFPFTIRNQLTTHFSTVEAAQALKSELLNFQRDFYRDAAAAAAKDATKAYVFGDSDDQGRTSKFLEILRRHEIKVYELAQNHKGFERGKAFVVPLEQRQYQLIRASFETYLQGDKNGFFTDSVFYDISAWTLPMAFGLKTQTLEVAAKPFLGREIDVATMPQGKILGKKSDYAYVFEWDEFYAPTVLAALQAENLLTKVATEPFKATDTDGQTAAFKRGTVVLQIQNQGKTSDAIFSLLQGLAMRTGVKITALSTGFATEGVDLGSPSIFTLKRAQVAMLVGEGVTNLDAGEIWHLLDVHYEMPLSMLDLGNIARQNLSGYTALVLVDGSYNPTIVPKLKEFTAAGGTLIAFGRAIKFLKMNDLATVDFKSSAEKTTQRRRQNYAQQEAEEGSRVIGGAIFDAQTDRTHPLLYGYNAERLPVFRADTLFMAMPQNAYAAPLVLTAKPLLSGYLKPFWNDFAANSPAIVVSQSGNGRAILMVENPVFRAFWFGTNKLVANMIFFGGIINPNTIEKRGN
jgi:hypothetical protein